MSEKSIICIGAHPDDIEFSCTATVHKLMQTGYKATFVILTNGENGFKSNHASRQQRIETRKNEQLAVAKKMGLEEVVFLDYKDGFLEYSEELRAKLVEIIKRIRPETIFSFDPANHSFNNLNLYHRDHRVAAEAVFDACFAAKNLWMYPGEAHMVKKIYFFGSDQPDYFEDISDLIEYKLDLLKYHQSQFPDFSRVVRFVKEDISSQTEVFEYSEPFRILDVEQIT